MIVVFEGEAGGGAGGGESELIDYFFPEFVVRDSLPASFFADCFIEFVEIEFLSSDLWYFDLSNSFGSPVLCQMFLEFILLLQL